MIDHVSLRTSDLEASEGFYETVVGTLGLEQTYKSEHLVAWGDFALAPGKRRATGHAAVAHRFRRPVTRAGRRVLAGRYRGGVPRRSPAVPGAPLKPK